MDLVLVQNALLEQNQTPLKILVWNVLLEVSLRMVPLVNLVHWELLLVILELLNVYLVNVAMNIKQECVHLVEQDRSLLIMEAVNDVQRTPSRLQELVNVLLVE